MPYYLLKIFSIIDPQCTNLYFCGWTYIFFLTLILDLYNRKCDFRGVLSLLYFHYFSLLFST